MEYMEKCIIAICKPCCVRDQCGRKLQLPYMSAGSFKMSIKLVKQFLGHMEKSMYGLNVKTKIMVRLSTP